MAVKTKTKSDRIILNKQLLKQFGKDYRPPTLEECQVAPKATLQEILKELNVPPATAKSLASICEITSCTIKEAGAATRKAAIPFVVTGTQ